MNLEQNSQRIEISGTKHLLEGISEANKKYLKWLFFYDIGVMCRCEVEVWLTKVSVFCDHSPSKHTVKSKLTATVRLENSQESSKCRFHAKISKSETRIMESNNQQHCTAKSWFDFAPVRFRSWVLSLRTGSRCVQKEVWIFSSSRAIAPNFSSIPSNLRSFLSKFGTQNLNLFSEFDNFDFWICLLRVFFGNCDFFL